MAVWFGYFFKAVRGSLDIVIFSSGQSWSKEGSGEFVRKN